MEENQAEEIQDTSCKTPRWRLLKAQLNNLKPQQFKAAMEEAEQPIVVDVRTENEYLNQRIPTAIHIDYFGDNFWDEIEKLDNTRSIFIYCRSGRRSIRACTLMRNGGFDNDKVFNLDGGMIAWVEDGFS